MSAEVEIKTAEWQIFIRRTHVSYLLSAFGWVGIVLVAGLVTLIAKLNL